jgi:hypothetical protein
MIDAEQLLGTIIMDRFDRIEKRQDNHDTKLDKMLIEVTKLKVKATLWGMGSGGLAAVLAILFKVLA